MVEAPKFYTDVHIAKEAIRQLQHKGVDILHAADVGMKDVLDPDHLVYATENKRVMVSCDDDFLRHHAEWQALGKEHSGIVYFRMPDQCKSIGVIVGEIYFLHEAADYLTDLYNQVWMAKT